MEEQLHYKVFSILELELFMVQEEIGMIYIMFFYVQSPSPAFINSKKGPSALLHGVPRVVEGPHHLSLG